MVAPTKLSSAHQGLAADLIKAGYPEGQAIANAYIWQARAEAGINRWNTENPDEPMTMADWLALYPLTVTATGSPTLTEPTLNQFVGVNAVTADRSAASKAYQRVMKGEDPETVRRETGWFMWVDGRWRCEIDDSKARFRGFDESTQEPEVTSTNTDAFMDWIEEAAGRERGIPLSQALDHPALFEAYPKLKTVRLKVDPSRKEGGLFTEIPSERLWQITIGDPYSYNRALGTALESVLHEVQHVIQSYEDFARGGNLHVEGLPSGVLIASRINAEFTARKDALKASPEYQALLAETLATLPESAYISARTGTRREEAGRQAAESLIYESSGLDALERERIARVDRVLSHIDYRGKDSAFAGYRHLAGEAEARNTVLRIGLSAEERLLTAPNKTLDISEADAILLRGDGRIAADMGRIVPAELDSTNRPLVAPGERIQDFLAFFGPSQARDARGLPLRLHHGSPVSDIEEFQGGHTAYGIFFTPDPETASYYARGADARIYDAYLRIDRLADFDDPVVFDEVAREAVDFKETRVDEDALRFADRLYREGYEKNPVVKAWFDEIEGVELIGDGYSAYDLLVEDRKDASDIEDLVAEIDSDVVTEAFNKACPLRSEELQWAAEAYGSQNFYLYYQNDFMRAAQVLGYDGVVFTDPSSTGQSVSYVVFDASQIRLAPAADPVPAMDIPSIAAGASEAQLLARLAAFKRLPDVDQFDRYEIREATIDALVELKLADPDFAGMILPVAHGHVSVTASAKSAGAWQVTYFDASMQPLSDSGIQTKEQALREFFAESNPGLMPGVDRTSSPEFSEWFGVVSADAKAEIAAWNKGGKVVDDQGFPVRVFHATDKAFTEVDMEKGAQGVFWVTSDRAAIDRGEVGASGSGVVLEMYVRIESPAGWDEYERLSIGELIAAGYDGVVLPDGDHFDAIVFNADQVKFAAPDLGSSKVVGAAGKPLRMFHGQPRPDGEAIEAFDSRTHLGDGIYFTSDPDYAAAYAVEFRAQSPSPEFDHAAQTGVLYPVYLSIRNPLILNGEDDEQRDRYACRGFDINELKAQGYDGVMLRYDDGEIEAMAFEPEQIKSVFNSGAFDRGNPNILNQSSAFVAPLAGSKVRDEHGALLKVYHGTAETVFVPGKTVAGSAEAVDELIELAQAHGIADWTSVAPVFERWAAGDGGPHGEVTMNMALAARALHNRSRPQIEPGKSALGFTEFHMPSGTKELGAHFGLENQASLFGEVFEFYLNIESPLRLPDLGTWDYQLVMREARKAGVDISETEYTAVFDAPDNNAALRELLLSKGVDGVVYFNEAEGFGDSYIAFRSDQVFPVAEIDRVPERGARVLAQSALQRMPDTLQEFGPLTLPAFRNWFGNSVVTKGLEPGGEPVWLFHGTDDDFHDFYGRESVGWFAEDPAFASEYALQRRSGLEESDEVTDEPVSAPNVMPVFVRIEKPLVIDVDMNDHAKLLHPLLSRIGFSSMLLRQMHLDSVDQVWEIVNNAGFLQAVEDLGYDGVRVRERGHWTWSVMQQSQVKSVFNSGSFSRQSPRILDQSPVSSDGIQLDGYRGSLPPSVDNSPAASIVVRQTETESFKRFFGNSPVVAGGKPRRMYHGSKSPEALSVFVPGGPEGARQTGDLYGLAAYFTSDAAEASRYAGPSGAVLPVYLAGNILDLDAPWLSEEHAQGLSSFANMVLLPSDLARFPSGRKQAEFSTAEQAGEFFRAKRAEWVSRGDGMDRALPEVVEGGERFVVEYTDFDAQITISSGPDAYTLFSAIGWDNVPLAGFDGVMLDRGHGDGRTWVVMHNPEGNVKSALGNNGAFNSLSARILDQTAFTGSPATDIEAFDLSKSGSAGGNSYGYGVYLSESEQMADFYRQTLSRLKGWSPEASERVARAFAKRYPASLEMEGITVNDLLGKNSGYLLSRMIDDWAEPEFVAWANDQGGEGRVYAVTIPDNDELLIWDAVASDQPEAIREILYARSLHTVPLQPSLQLSGVVERTGEPNGSDIYLYLCEVLKSDAKASAMLSDLGIKGLTYKQMSFGTKDFVIFKPEDAQIIRDSRADKAFRQFFRASQATVDGRPGSEPLRLYHGASADFEAFSLDHVGSANDHGFCGRGFYFMDDPEWASGYAEVASEKGGNAVVLPVYLSMQNPLVISRYEDLPGYVEGGPYVGEGAFERGEEMRQRLIDLGYDGVITKGKPGNPSEYMVFHPNQIKSAIGNNGNYDRRSPNILNQSAAGSRQPLSERSTFRDWFGKSKAQEMIRGSSSKDAVFAPMRFYHSTRSGGFDSFEANRPTINTTTFADVETTRAAIFFTPSVEDSNAYVTQDGKFVNGATTMPVYLKAENPLDIVGGVGYEDEQRLVAAGFSERFIHNNLTGWAVFDGHDGADLVRMLESAGYDSVIFSDENPNTGDSFESWAVFHPEQIKSAIGNNGDYDRNSQNILNQSAVAPVFDFTLPADGNVLREYSFDGARICLSIHADGEVSVSSLRVPVKQRGRGIARRAMVALVRQADAEGVTLKVGASALDKRTRTSRLVDFYRSLGFVLTGRKINALGEPELMRAPDTSPLGRRLAAGVLEQMAWHGTPHDYERIDLSRAGSSEGAADFGWGMYFAGKREVAAHYTSVFGVGGSPVPQFFEVDGVRTSSGTPLQKAADLVHGLGLAKARKMAREWHAEAIAGDEWTQPNGVEFYASIVKIVEALKSAKSVQRAPGFLLSAQIPDDDVLLDWHSPFSAQPKAVQDAMTLISAAMPLDVTLAPGVTGEAWYKSLARFAGSQRQASHLLAANGVPGITYLERPLSKNSVIFDEKLIRQLSKEQLRTLDQFAGRKAATADMTALKKARKMLRAGDPEPVIWKETGWRLGVDGQWRFELDDSAAALRQGAVASLLSSAEPMNVESFLYSVAADGSLSLELRAAGQAKGVLIRCSEATAFTLLPAGVLEQISSRSGAPVEMVVSEQGDTASGFRLDQAFRFQGFNALPLCEVLDHPALFAAYPQLGRSNDACLVGLQDGFQCSTSMGQQILIGREHSPEGMLRFLLHEIQHVIQEIEGFGRGGSPDMAFADPRMNPRATRAGNRAAREMLVEMVEKLAEPSSLEDYARNAWGVDADGVTEEVLDAYADYVKGLKESFDSGRAGRLAQDTVAREWYRRLAGEIESRVVERRWRLTAEQRREQPVSGDEDIPTDKAIVLRYSASALCVDQHAEAAGRLGSMVDQYLRTETGLSPWFKQSVVDSANWGKGECEKISADLVAWLKWQGVDARLVFAQGLTRGLDAGAAGDWTDFTDRGGDTSHFWHAAVFADGLVIDLSGSQFGGRYSGVRLLAPEDFHDEWEVVRLSRGGGRGVDLRTVSKRYMDKEFIASGTAALHLALDGVPVSERVGRSDPRSVAACAVSDLVATGLPVEFALRELLAEAQEKGATTLSSALRSLGSEDFDFTASRLYRPQGRLLDWAQPISEQACVTPAVTALAEGLANWKPAVFELALNRGVLTGSGLFEGLVRQAQAEQGLHLAAAVSHAGKLLTSAGITGVSVVLGVERLSLPFDGDNDRLFDALKNFREEPPRAQIAIGQNLTFDIRLLTMADSSSFGHEVGHAFLEILRDQARRTKAPDSQIRRDWAAVSQWLKLDKLRPDEAIPTQAHERFARGFELYLRRGDAPSVELEGVFELLASLLRQIYEAIKDLFVTVPAEINVVYDRMLATDEQLARKQPAAVDPEPVVAVSKIARFADNDKEDIAALVELGLTTSDDIAQRAEEAVSGFVGGLGMLRANIRDAVELAVRVEIQRDASLGLLPGLGSD